MNEITLDNDAYEVLDYCERYVNDGSPSGFGVSSQLAPTFDPFSNRASFSLLRTSEHFFVKSETLGKLEPLECSDEFFLHPMMSWQYIELGCKIELGPDVQPTSSGRTVVSLNKPRKYIKLHFDATLGRVNRSQPYSKAAAGIEISGILKKAMCDNLLPGPLSLLEETGAKVVWHSKEKSSSFIIRSPHFLSNTPQPACHAIPYFSVFSRDRKQPRTLVSAAAQMLLDRVRENLFNKADVWLSRVLLPVVQTYFQSIRELGLQIEFNAQNLLILLDENASPLGIVLRDFSGVEKDLGLPSRYWPNKFLSEGYKFIDPALADYQMRHSFSFDAKLSEYVIRPIIDLLRTRDVLGSDEVLSALRSVVHKEVQQLPEGFFPHGLWYSHPKILLTGTRPYVSFPNPLLR